MPIEGKEIFRRLSDAINSGHLHLIDEIFTPDHVRHDPTSLMREAGIAEYKAAFKKLRAAFPDAHWTLEEVLEASDRVVGRWTFSGTHKGRFFKLAPTRRTVTYPIIGIYRIEDGRIAEDWHVFHALGLWETLIPEIKALIEEAQGSG